MLTLWRHEITLVSRKCPEEHRPWGATGEHQPRRSTGGTPASQRHWRYTGLAEALKSSVLTEALESFSLAKALKRAGLADSI